MKLASLKHKRDGRLFVLSNDLAWCADASHIVPTLQAALDDWDRYLPDLQNLATDLAHEAIPRARFHEHDAASPLPRAYQWADGSAYVNHVALVRQARGAEMPESFRPCLLAPSAAAHNLHRGACGCTRSSADTQQ